MTIFAERGNRVVQITESSINKYSALGYKIVNELGTVLVDTVPKDLPTLTLAYKKSIEENKSLKEQLSKALAEIKALKEAVQTVQPSASVSEEPKADTTAKPSANKNGTKKSKAE